MSACEGPLIWWHANDEAAEQYAGILECVACGYVIVTGNFHDAQHTDTPFLFEGLAS